MQGKAQNKHYRRHHGWDQIKRKREISGRALEHALVVVHLGGRRMELLLIVRQEEKRSAL